MSYEIISRKTRKEFREYMVSWYLDQIREEFDDAGIDCDTKFDPNLSGERRTLVEQYYHTLDFRKWEDVKKALAVYEGVLLKAQHGEKRYMDQLIRVLERDGFRYIDGRIVHSTRIPHLPSLNSLANELGAQYLGQQIVTIEANLESNPTLAIGTAKELIETCCKTILSDRGRKVSGSPDVPQLVKQTLKELRLLPEDIPEEARGAATIKRLLSNLATIPQGLAELRNIYGTGHGKDGRARGLQTRHAKLAAGAAATLAIFMFETHRERAEDDQEK